MWLSKNICNNNSSNPNKAENAVVTISNENGLEINGSTNSRNIKTYSPYGYCYVTPSGEDALILPTSFGLANLGTKVDSSGLKKGEIKISNNSGAYILLKNDGSVEINGRIIGKDGLVNDNK